MPKINLFTKIVVILAIMLVPIMGLYFLSNRTSTEVLRDELNDSNTNRLVFFQSQVNTNIESISLWPNLLIHDPDISELRDTFVNPGPSLPLELITLVNRIQRKLSIQENSSNWSSSLFIYSPVLNRVVSSNDVRAYDDSELKQRMKQGWQVKPDGNGQFLFSLFTVAPYISFDRPETANLIIEVRFDSRNIVGMLDKFKSDGRRDPFFYKKETGVIYNSTADREIAEQLVAKLEALNAIDVINQTVKLDGIEYLVNTQRSNTTEWYLLDYIPLSEVVGPIVQSNRLFYISVGSLLLMSCVLAYVLYAQVQSPLKQLVGSFQKLKYEDYSVRLKPKGNNEFSFVFMRFNSMVTQIQELFEKVYLEQIHVREARLKQLQSQINPHFFYNCFSFISSMAKMKNHEAVVAMSQNLSSYYRYTTRQERDFVSLSDELEFVGSYLEIQKLRRNRLEFAVELPPRLRKIDIPPLIVQPLVENAVLHGIEEKAGEGIIRVAVSDDGGWFRIVVDDNGKGLDEAARRELELSLSEPMTEKTGCGLWNVNQRLQLRYGENAGVSIEQSELGGLKVILHWQYKETTEAGDEA
ncbi:sensor histidine kinase [Cohnella lupini]|uniref:Two-component system sensor histidine kinase YesM n=1 Tax=Cohnella lupini TaxID=1294267 RepID=A0A3D9IQC3_9BACL|nr:sensor histidine kinase [Cohnella lupini]RED63971.1 two-component system sensor histidine kinase YesM [Cohnella lupini]